MACFFHNAKNADKGNIVGMYSFCFIQALNKLANIIFKSNNIMIDCNTKQCAFLADVTCLFQLENLQIITPLQLVPLDISRSW